jgi:arylsulfatase A-like enzyme/Flp pilus assembly protein TadD
MLCTMRAKRTVRAVLLGLGAAGAIAATAWLWHSSRGVARVDLRGFNVLLVTIDTLRADRLGAYGSRAGLTPVLDALATRGVRFTRAWSHTPITLPAHASILTGLLPPHHGVRNNGAFRLGSRPATLAECLRAAGYRTGAFVGAFVLDARFGLNRGFDEYDDRYQTDGVPASFHFTERSADHVLRSATDWITRSETGVARPWFAWVHLFDPHAPYQAPAAFAHGRAPYDAEVAWTDSAIGSALDTLRSAGQMDRTLVVLTADHGEALGDHGETTHGLFAYDATLRVPLIISAPTLRHASVSERTSHVDILPTILDLLGMDSPGGLDGRALFDRAGSAPADPGSIYFEALDANLTRGWAPLRGVVSDRWKYIDLPEPELYDLDADPDERSNLAGRELERVRSLQRILRQVTTAPSAAGATAVDSATAARLQSLGYLSGSAGSRDVYTIADDPKRLVTLSETFNAALDDYGHGHAAAAIEKLSAVLTERPDFLAARLSAATVLISGGRAADAVRVLREAPMADQAAPAWLTRMGQALAAAGALSEAHTVLESATEATRGDPEPLNELGVVLLRLNQVDAARRAFEKLLDADSTAAGTWFNLGVLEMGQRRTEAAALAFARVVELSPQNVDGWRGLGAALAGHDVARAVAAWQHVVERDPRDFDTLYNLGMLLVESGRRAEALPYLQRFLADAPRDRYADDLPRVRALVALSENPS